MKVHVYVNTDKTINYICLTSELVEIVEGVTKHEIELATIPDYADLFWVNGQLTQTEPEVVLTFDEKISVIRSKYDEAVQKVCTNNNFNDINSARNLARYEASPLHQLAIAITNWELDRQINFIDLLNSVTEKTVDTIVFEDEWVDFVNGE